MSMPTMIDWNCCFFIQVQVPWCTYMFLIQKCCCSIVNSCYWMFDHFGWIKTLLCHVAVDIRLHDNPIKILWCSFLPKGIMWNIKLISLSSNQVVCAGPVKYVEIPKQLKQFNRVKNKISLNQASPFVMNYLW